MTKSTGKFIRGQHSLNRTCPICKIDFVTFVSISKVCCSLACEGERRKRAAFERNKRTCIICGTVFALTHPKKPSGTCSRKCSAKRRTLPRIDRMGYWAVFVPDHPNATQQGYVFEHRLIAEKMLGRTLNSDEAVHHINGNRKDNRAGNLRVMSDSAHKSLHAKQHLRAFHLR